MARKDFTALETMDGLIWKIRSGDSPDEILKDFRSLMGAVENTYIIVKNAPSFFSSEAISSTCDNIASLQKIMDGIRTEDWKIYDKEARELGSLLNKISGELRKMANKKRATCDL